MAAENCLWGAPRIHGELLKLGIAVLERTVSRYLRGRPTTRSQTRRTFFANLLGDRTLISPVMFADARSNDIVVDACDVSCRRTPRAIDALCVSSHAANVDWYRSLQQSSLDLRPGHDHLQDRTGARRAPAGTRRKHLRCAGLAAFGRFHSCVPTVPLRPSAARDHSPPARRVLPWAILELPFLRNQVINIDRRPNTSFGPRHGCLRCDSHGDRNIGEAQHPITVSGTIRVPANERITRFRWPHFHASVRGQCVGGLLTHYDRPA